MSDKPELKLTAEIDYPDSCWTRIRLSFGDGGLRVPDIFTIHTDRTAQFIRAINSHSALLAACKRMVGTLQEMRRAGQVWPSDCGALDEGECAIRAAEPKKEEDKHES